MKEEINRLLKEPTEVSKTKTKLNTDLEKYEYIKNNQHLLVSFNIQNPIQHLRQQYYTLISRMTRDEFKSFDKIKEELIEVVSKFLISPTSANKLYCDCSSFEGYLEKIKREYGKERGFFLDQVKTYILRDIPKMFYGSEVEKSLRQLFEKSLMEFEEKIKRGKEILHEGCRQICSSRGKI